MASNLQVVPMGRTARVSRRPQHTFTAGFYPFCIQPVFIAPVLPGETLKNLLFQARVVSSPVKNPLVGWWCEWYCWYVKHRDLNERDSLVAMMIDPSARAPATATAVPIDFHYANGVDYVGMCLRRCVETYFRDTGETWNAGLRGPWPLASVTQQTALESALLDAAYLAGSPGLVVGADDTITGAEIDATWILWQQYRASNLTTLSYEEYLNTYGIPLPAGAESSHRPELIRYVKDWSYPTNTVDPLTGAPTSALSWAIAERADKDRFFREPGFIFGAMCVRPKVYFNGQAGSVTCAMNDALSWLPAVMGNNPEYSVRQFPASGGPYSGITAPYRVDLKDLFLYGEMYRNVAVGNVSNVALPSGALLKKYPASADVDGLFKTPTSNLVSVDGVCSLNILGNQVDTSPTTAPGTF